MTSKLLLSTILLGGISIGAFFPYFNSPVKGTVTPEDAALKAFLFSASDTMSVNVDKGNIQFFNVKPGMYKLLIEARPPYRNEVREGIRVVDGELTDLGRIEMRNAPISCAVPE